MLPRKKDCCGCAACANVCELSCITMKPDITGFEYPEIDFKRCVGCGRCERACPALISRQNKNSNSKPVIHAVAQHRVEEILRQTTSGGAFAGMAEYVVQNGGVVYGASLGKSFVVGHIRVETAEDLALLRGSKYCQSRVGISYRMARDDLEAGRTVLFSGTPCQVSGLKRFLGKEYQNLYTVDVVCRAVPSPKIFQKYVQLRRREFDRLDRLTFRDKGLGYSYPTLAVYGEKRGKAKIYRRGKESDEWYRLFFGGYCNRESCYGCTWQSGARESDITLWDCFRVYRLAPSMDNDLGATNAAVWTDKGKNLLTEAKGFLYVREVESSAELRHLERNNRALVRRDSVQFYSDVDAMSPEDFFQKYAPNNLKAKGMNLLRKASMKLGVYQGVRKALHTLRDKL